MLRVDGDHFGEVGGDDGAGRGHPPEPSRRASIAQAGSQQARRREHRLKESLRARIGVAN